MDQPAPVLVYDEGFTFSMPELEEDKQGGRRRRIGCWAVFQ